SIFDVKPEALQTALYTTAVGALVASQEVLPSYDQKWKRNHIVYWCHC
ncbi:unnamed protein product, partial [Rotaria sordida]